MYAARILLRTLNLSSTRVLSKPCLKERFQLTSVRQKFTSFNFKPQLEKDVVLYKLEKPSYFFYINCFSVIQCAFWTHMGIFLYQKIWTVKASGSEKEKSFWKSVLDSEKYASVLSCIALIFGWSILCGTSFYTFRSIRKLTLNKGGKTVTIITYSIPGFTSTKKLPLSQVSSTLHRTHAKKFIPLKVKNKFFYYLIDTKGEFYNPELFDFTAGINRNI